ncbi:CoA transferase [Peribacillus asahii]|mgnify:CR=1 FL=1|uniref:CoA transferase n=1 Tax=Peribacillus asahii TaxID=228899 RepID=A0A398BCM6_9BACI|nr:CoA transferase [Peribacillus asahii]RID87567.1 CoA transferase [Peribacillus asahii]
MSQALEGLLVLDLGQIYNGPYCSLMLAYQGAKVVKVEPMDGESLRKRRKDCHEFLMFNSNKLGITLNLKTEEGKELFLDLVKKADVVLENYARGVMDRLGLGYETLKEVNPRLIYATGKGYGLEGPYADWPAMDITIQAISGVMSSTGFPDGPPVKAGPAFSDIMGAIHLFGGITTALYQREKTGKGQLVEVAMHDTMYPVLASPLGGFYRSEGTLPERTGNRHSGLAIAPYNVYPVKDGYIAIFCDAQRHWESLANHIGRADLLEDSRFRTNVDRAKNVEVIDKILTDWLADKKKWDIVEGFYEARIPSAPVLSIAEVADDPHLIARKMIVEIDHPEKGKIKVPGSPIRLSDSPLDEVVPAPLLGQHTDKVLMEYVNLNEEQLSDLRKKQVIQ